MSPWARWPPTRGFDSLTVLPTVSRWITAGLSPFGENCGFTMAESAQVVILMDDALALELGAPSLLAHRL